MNQHFGDSMGIQETIKGLNQGVALHIKGEWNTKERAYSHGGARMSVLHFTQDPLGFICTPIKCYT
jgi:endonuclease G